MENASKALIIAGAILLSILLITLGIMVMRNAQGTIDDANLDSETIQTSNNKITQYCGNNKSATEMNALMDAIASHNGAQKKLVSSKQHFISVDTSGVSDSKYVTTKAAITITSATSSISYPRFSEGTTFTATYTTDATGYVNKVTIK